MIASPCKDKLGGLDYAPPIMFASRMSDAQIARTDDISTEAVGARVRALRMALGMPQTTFGAKVGAGKATVQSWENARSAPTYAHLHRILKEYRVSSGFIIYGAWDELPAGLWSEIRCQLMAAGSATYRTAENPT